MARIRIECFSVRVSTSELLRLNAAAKALGMPTAAWVRHQALRAAGGMPEPPLRFQAPPPQSPPVKITRTVRTGFSEEQFEAISEYSRGCGLTNSRFIRMLVLGHKPITRRPLARSAIVAVNQSSANLNRLVKLADSGTLLAPDLKRAVAEVLDQIHTLRDALLRADAACGPVARE